MPKKRPLNRADIAFLYRMIAQCVDEFEWGTVRRRKMETDGQVIFRLMRQYTKKVGITPKELEDVLLVCPVTVLDVMYPVVREKTKRPKSTKSPKKYDDAWGETTPLIGRGSK